MESTFWTLGFVIYCSTDRTFTTHIKLAILSEKKVFYKIGSSTTKLFANLFLNPKIIFLKGKRTRDFCNVFVNVNVMVWRATAKLKIFLGKLLICKPHFKRVDRFFN